MHTLSRAYASESGVCIEHTRQELMRPLHTYAASRIQPAIWTCRSRAYPFHRQQYERAVCIHFHSQQYGCAGVGRIPFHRQQYERAVCVPFHSQQNRRAGCNHFHSQQYGRAVQGVFPSTAGSMHVQGVSSSTTSSMNVPVQGTKRNKNADAGTSSVPE
jgi:hypothetical protein